MNDNLQPASRPWYQIDGIENIDSPALMIDAGRVRKNIAAAIAMTGDAARLRPHVKTHKSPAVTRLMLAQGITKFKCATIAEADMLGSCGAPDVLLAYQPIGPKGRRFLALMHRYPATRFSCLVDNLAAAKELNEQAAAHNLILNVFIDLNVGMNRTGIVPGKEATALASAIAGLMNVKLCGLHAYDGHITDPDLSIRTKKAGEALALAIAFRQEMETSGFADLTLVAGGSPTFPVLAKEPGIECSPGTFVFWDAGYSEAYPEQPFQPAAVVISRVISVLPDGKICTDLGHKSIAAENPLPRRVRFINAPGLTVVGQSEEHLVLNTEGQRSFAVGDVLYGLPIHICPTCALYERAIVIENHAVTGEWMIAARDRKIND